MANFPVVPVAASKYNTPRVVLVDADGNPAGSGGSSPKDAKVTATKVGRRVYRGINVAGAEFTSTGTPLFDSAASFRFLASRGHTLVRLPFLWESIQPTLGAALDSAALTALKAAVKAAGSAGLSVVLDVHNYGKYNNIFYGAAGGFTLANFTDLWKRLSDEFKGDPYVIGYGLMNEPRDLPTVGGVSGNDRWKIVQQAALDTIRANGDVTCVIISGYNAASIGSWTNASLGQPTPYIVDPANNFRWEAHSYWDSATTGQYTTTYAQAVAAGFGSSQGDAARTRFYFELNQWLTWLKDYGQKGFLGEFGWPSSENGDTPSDAAAWNSLADMWLNRLDQEDSDLAWFAAWATGDRWSDGYNLQYYESTAGVLSTPLSNAAILEKHLAGPTQLTAAQKTALTAHTTDTANPHAVTKAQVGLANVDNTSDANKPVSTATTAAISAHATDVNNPHAVTKAQVGLGNVDNTSDANKPVSTAQQTAIDASGDKMGAATGTVSGTLSWPATFPATRVYTLGGNLTIAATPSNPASTVSGTVTAIFKQAATGGPYTVTWPATLEWAGDALAPAMPTNPNAELIVNLLWTGVAWRAMVAGVFYP